MRAANLLRYAAGLVALALLLGACADESTAPDGIACTEEARSSVTVTVVDGDGAPISDATVTFTVDGGDPETAEHFTGNEYVAGWERTGVFVITAEKEGYQPAQETVTVVMEDDGCHVASQAIELTLLPEP